MEYDAWLQVTLTEICNLTCRYCLAKEELSRPSAVATTFDAPAFLNSLRQCGYVFHVVFTGGGEPFALSSIVDLCAEIAAEHYIGLNTNLTYGKRIAEFVRRVPSNRVSRIHASLHFHELRRLGILEDWLCRYAAIRNEGYRIDAIPVAHPSISEGEVQTLEAALQEAGGNLSWAPFIGEWNHRIFPKSYTQEEMTRFRFKGTYSHSDVYAPQGWLCPAGVRVAHVDAKGDVWVCHSIPEKLGTIKDGFTLRDTPVKCSLKCACPYFAYEPELLLRAIRSNMHQVSRDSLLYHKGEVVHDRDVLSTTSGATKGVN